MPNELTRRALLGAIGVTSIAAAASAAAAVIPAIGGADDAAIEADWHEMLSLRAELSTIDYDEPLNGPLWTAVDRCECRIQEARATTVKGAETQLWLALLHMLDPPAQEQAVLARDLAPLSGRDLDWQVRLVVSAIQSLRFQREG